MAGRTLVGTGVRLNADELAGNVQRRFKLPLTDFSYGAVGAAPPPRKPLIAHQTLHVATLRKDNGKQVGGLVQGIFKQANLPKQLVRMRCGCRKERSENGPLA